MDGTFSPWFRIHECPVGRSLSRAPSHLGVVPTCADSASPGLAAVSRPPALTNRSNPQRYKFPGIPFGGGSFRTPPSPASRRWPAAFATVFFLGQPSNDALDL